MGCSCKNKANGSWAVKLPGGLEIKKSSEAAAKAFASSHPGSKVIKKS